MILNAHFSGVCGRVSVEVPVLLCTEYIFQYLYSNVYVSMERE